MSTRRIRIEAHGLDAWIDGFGRLSHVTEGMEGEWHQATGAMFDRSQKAVHVITGELKRSGRYETGHTRGRAEGRVIYGGNAECDYAIYEFARGGPHDALRIAFVEATQRFKTALGEMLGAEVRWWR